MYFILYDRNLKSIGKPYLIESWSRIERAIDFDDLKIIGEQIPYSAEPFIIVANDKKGKMLFSGLASTPISDEKQKKSSIYLKDYATLFNSEIIVNWSEFTGANLDEFISFVLDKWLQQTDVGFENIVYDVSKVANIRLDSNISLGNSMENVSVHDLIFDAINYYNLYYKATLDLSQKKLSFSFFSAGKNIRDIKLSDFDQLGIEKSFGDYNRACVYDYTYTKKEEWALTENNTVVKLPSVSKLVYPAKNKNFIAEEDTQDSVYKTIYEAVMSLAQNRYQVNLDLNAQQYRSIIDLTSVDFSYSINVYADEDFYKKLPVGEIETDSTGKHIVRLGYRIQELTQEI